MPAIPCNCGCGCYNDVGYYGLDQKFERDDFPQICENCEEGFHYQDHLDALNQDDENNAQTISKSECDDALTILDKRLARGEITLEEFIATKKAIMGKDDKDDIEKRGNIESEEMLPEDRLSLNLKTAYAELVDFLKETKKGYDNMLKISPNSKDQPDVRRLEGLIKRIEDRLAEHEKVIAEKLDHEIVEKNHQIYQLKQELEKLYPNQMTYDKLKPLLLEERLKTWDQYNIEVKNSLFHEIEETKKNRSLFGSKKPLIIIFERDENGLVRPVKFK